MIPFEKSSHLKIEILTCAFKKKVKIRKVCYVTPSSVCITQYFIQVYFGMFHVDLVFEKSILLHGQCVSLKRLYLVVPHRHKSSSSSSGSSTSYIGCFDHG